MTPYGKYIINIDQIIYKKILSKFLGRKLNVFRMITAAVWVMMMQLGFAMFEAGSIRAKNTSNILLKSVIDIFTGFITFFICGYGMMSELQGGIIGTGPFMG